MFNRYALSFISLLFIGLQYACNSADKEATQTTIDAVAKTATQPTQADTNKNAYFGDLHIHTSWSFDAFVFNVKIDPDLSLIHI